MPKRGEVLFAGGDAGRLAEAGQVLADIAGSDAGEFEPPRFGPRKKLIDGRKVSPAGVIIANGAEEKLFGRKDGG